MDKRNFIGGEVFYPGDSIFELITNEWKLFQKMEVGGGGEEVEYGIPRDGGYDVEVRKYEVYLSYE